MRIYLDQNKWIDLARAATGHSGGERFAEVLKTARAAVASGEVSFPLDMYRYWETSKRGNDLSRNDVADLMWELSGQQTMSPAQRILDVELDLAFHGRFGRPEHPLQPRVFGSGLQHITGGRMAWPALNLSALPDGGATLPDDQRLQLQSALDEALEQKLLRAGPNDFRAAGFDRASFDLGQRYVAQENRIAAAIAKRGLKGDELDFAVRAADRGDIRDAVVEALERIDLTWEEFIEGTTPADLMTFMDELPTRYVTNVMRSAKLRQAEQKWEPNDFIDIVALPVAAVYCDVVITEKQWVHHMRQGKVGQRYDTVLLSDAADLVNVLANV